MLITVSKNVEVLASKCLFLELDKQLKPSIIRKVALLLLALLFDKYISGSYEVNLNKNENYLCINTVKKTEKEHVDGFFFLNQLDLT